MRGDELMSRLARITHATPDWIIGAESAITGITADSRRVTPGDVFAALPGGRLDGRRFIAEAVARGAAAVLAPVGTAWPAGVPPRPLIEDEQPRRRLAQFAARLAGAQPAVVVAITGTNGKSTTTALLAQMLAEAGWTFAAGGNLGPAALALPLLPDAGIYVLEMSSYLLERIATVRFDAAAMLNLSPDHLDRHGDMAGYGAAKRQIFASQDAACTAVIGIDDPDSRAMAAEARPARLLRVSGEGAADLGCVASVLRDAEGPLVALAEAAALPGAHNAQNAAAAAALALALGVPRAAIADGIRRFPGLPHRQERIRCLDGVAFINDSKATNADSAARALACHDRIVWIAGGIAKAEGIAPLAPYFPRLVEALLIGRDAPVLAATLAAHGVAHRSLGTLDAAVPAAWRAAREAGAVVLLSPACASFDQFAGFEARGERFRALVADLGRAA
jgi:UDP-N-acetylmuramoylalanine--D-glutamate ligase